MMRRRSPKRCTRRARGRCTFVPRRCSASDATTAERVTGRLDRRAVELTVAESRLATLVAAVETVRRGGPVRWHATPIIARGRLA